MGFPFGITVTFQRWTDTETVDRYGNAIYQWVDAAVVDGVGFAPAAPIILDQQGRDGQELKPVLYGVPVDAGVQNHDRCLVGGTLYEVEGTPQAWVNPMSGWDPGTVTALKRVEG